MRIALVILHGDPRRGGAERYTHNLASSLRKRDHEPVVIASSAPADVVVAATGSSRSRRYSSFCESVAAYLRDQPFDLVHAMLPLERVTADLYHPHAGMAGQRSGWLSWWTNPRRRRFAAAEAVHAADPQTTFVTLSDYVAGLTRRIYPTLPATRVRRIFNAVDIDHFKLDGPRIDLGSGPVVLFVGNDWRRKGLGDVLKAVAATDARLAVAGVDRPRVMTAHRKIATSLGLGERVLWLGRRDDADMLYRSADVFCHASRHDPCSLATLEALASGLPVVGTATDGATEAMAVPTHGRIATPATLPQVLQDVLDTKTLKAMKVAVPDLRPSLAWPRHVDAVVDLYHEIYQRRSTT